MTDPASEEWTVIEFPAIARTDDELGRKPGEALWPERYDEQRLAIIEQAIGPAWWTALYEQKPSKPGGSIFRSANFLYYWREGPEFVLENRDGLLTRFRIADCLCMMTCDTALKAKEENDWTVFQTSYVTPDKRLLVDHIERHRLEVPDQWPALNRAYRRRKPHVLAIENKASGIGLLQKCRREKLPVQALDADQDKYLRAEPSSVAYERGDIYHNVNGQWLPEFEGELLEFPRGEHDDQVDTNAYAWLIVEGRQCFVTMPKDRREARSEETEDREKILEARKVIWEGNGKRKDRGSGTRVRWGR